MIDFRMHRFMWF